MMHDRVKMLAALVLALAVAAPQPAGAQVRRDSAVLGMVLEPSPGLDPTTAAAAAIGEIVHYNIFEGLTKINLDGSVTPLLAESWSIDPDGKSYTFHLRKGVKFHDGEPFGAADVKFSFERAKAPGSTNKAKKAVFDNISRVETPDAATVIVVLNQPDGNFLFRMGENTAVILSPKSAPGAATQPVGTGPYKLEAWAKGASITLVKSDAYRNAVAVKLKKVVFRFINDPAAQVAALLAGDIDGMPRFGSIQALKQFQSDARFTVVAGGTEGKTIVSINNKRKPFDDLRVRQALAFAVDRKALIEGAVNGLGAPIGSHLVPSDPGYVDLTGEYPHDPEKAKALLKAAGVTTPLNVGLILPPPSYAPPRRRNRRRRTRRGRNPGEDRERRMGAMAVGRLQGQELRPHDHRPRRAARHRHLRQPRLLFPIRQPEVPRHLRQADRGARPRGVQGGDRRRATPTRRRQRQRLPVPTAAGLARRRAPDRPVAQRADFRHRPCRAIVAVSRARAREFVDGERPAGPAARRRARIGGGV